MIQLDSIVAVAVALALLHACGGTPRAGEPAEEGRGPGPDDRVAEREAMVLNQIAGRGIEDERVLAAMRRVPRHRFVPIDVREFAYDDHALPLTKGQTISQPYIVASMSEAAAVGPDERVLEVGTGSGYQAAVLAELAEEVYTIEIVPSLAESATRILAPYDNVTVRLGDGYRGWPEWAPFDAIVVTAAPDHVPPALREQLALGGRLVIPVGERYQELLVIERTAQGFEERRLYPVRFVPMTGEAEDR